MIRYAIDQAVEYFTSAPRTDVILLIILVLCIIIYQVVLVIIIVIPEKRKVSEMTNDLVKIHKHSLTLGRYDGAFFRSLPFKHQKKTLGL